MSASKKQKVSAEERVFLFSSESVNEGHPDKLADQVSDAVLDACLTADPYSKVRRSPLATALARRRTRIRAHRTAPWAPRARRSGLLLAPAAPLPHLCSSCHLIP